MLVLWLTACAIVHHPRPWHQTTWKNAPQMCHTHFTIPRFPSTDMETLSFSCQCHLRHTTCLMAQSERARTPKHPRVVGSQTHLSMRQLECILKMAWVLPVLNLEGSGARLLQRRIGRHSGDRWFETKSREWDQFGSLMGFRQ